LGAAQQASGALTAARTRIGQAHEQGVVDRVAVLEIEQSRLSSESSLVSSRAEALKALVAVFRATAEMEGS
jgi:outer membrane protein TolC